MRYARSNASNTKIPFMNSKKFLYFSFAYALFIIYGSLVPLDYRDMPFEDALLSFQQIRYLDLGAASRADWIANILLYIPLTFSLTAAFSNKAKPFALTLFISTLILGFSISLAVTIEFYQQFFPPRTVSQNDLIAETLGSVTGLVLWLGYGKHLTKLYQHILQGGKDALLASATLYILAYLTLSFFPYDFVTSFQELQNKLANGNDVFFISDSCGAFIQCSSKLTTEILLALPLGIFLSVLLRWHPRRIAAVVIVGLIIGIIIESIQLFLISGIAQGISILTRILGMWVGAKIYTYTNLLQRPLAFQVPDLKKHLLIATVPYFLLLAKLSGWTLATQGVSTNISEKFNNLNWLPFYYHYYTTEAVALTSLLSIFAMYLPIGIGFWLWNANKAYTVSAHPKLTASFYAVCLCFIIEAGKLFFVGKHPDPTNLLISFASVFISYSLIELMYKWFHQPETTLYKQNIDAYLNDDNQATDKQSLTNEKTENPIAKSIACIIFTLLFWKSTDYPNSSIVLMAALIFYGIILRKYPHVWLIIIPALLPVADLSPWTGRLFFTEFDYFILVTFGISLWYGRWKSPIQSIKPVALILLAIYVFCYFISLLKGLLPLQAVDANAFANYYSSYNSLRVAKGLIWMLFFLPLLSYAQQHEKKFKSYFSYGILSGLTAVVLFGIWERFIFTGLFDYSSDFRITSTFYSMHTGGAPLDAFLLLSIPFICILLIESKSIFLRTFFIPLLFSASVYTLLVTYSRGTYIAFVFTCITLMTGLFICYKKQLLNNWKKTLWLPLFLVIIAIVALPIVKGSFIQHRFSQATQEIETRSSHWLNSINMMDDNFLTTLFGMGLGSFPKTYAWNSFADQVPASFLIQQEKNDSYLQLGSGAPLYIEQIIDISANTDYQLKLDYRMQANNSRLNISICEKAIQHSFECQAIPLIPQQKNTWQHFEKTINTQKIGQTFHPVKLILRNSQTDAAIDIKNISLTATNKNNLIKNGTFSKGMDHWFFTADNHIPWRAENLWVQILFDQGWLGLITFNLILFYVMINLLRHILKHDYYAAITLASLTGFVVLSVIDSTLNHPIISLLFFMIIYISFISSTKSNKEIPLRPNRRTHILRHSKSLS
jgi:VanZ family protein